MSSQEIISELPKLSLAELEDVESRLQELLRFRNQEVAVSWGSALLELAGTAEGLPSDLAHNHDHYLHGSARQ